MDIIVTSGIVATHVKYNGMNYVSIQNRYKDVNISLNHAEMERLVQWWRDINPEGVEDVKPFSPDKIR